MKRKRRRTAAIKVRLSPAELKELHAWARMQNMTVSELVRAIFHVHRKVAADQIAGQVTTAPVELNRAA